MQTRAILFASLLLAGACDDPADHAPAAHVERASPAPLPDTAGDRQELATDAAHSSVGFTGSKVTASHDGSFGDFSGTVRLDPASIGASSVSITIQMSSLAIEPQRLHDHLLSPELFDVARFRPRPSSPRASRGAAREARTP